MNYCKIEAHRGVGTDAPENTLAAFLLAKEQGYDVIELDTKFTADNRCVILHDRTLNRTARNADGSPLTEEVRIADITLEEARGYDVGLSFDETSRGERIPTLEEALAFSLENGIPLTFDNVLMTHTEEQQQIFFDTVERMGAADNIGFTSYDVDFIKKILARFPDTMIHFVCQGDLAALCAVAAIVPRERLYAWVRYDNDRSTWCHAQAATDEFCAEVRKSARLALWLLDKDDEYLEAQNRYLADIIETDGRIKPERVRKSKS